MELEAFGRVASWFGPLNKTKNFKNTFLDTVEEVVCAPWFHGDQAAPDSERILLTKDCGTFLVRFSTAAFGAFAISKGNPPDLLLTPLVANTENKKEIHHQRFFHVLGTDQYALDEQTSYNSIQELLTKESEKLHLKQPCLGSPFTSLVIQEHIEGYVGS